MSELDEDDDGEFLALPMLPGTMIGGWEMRERVDRSYGDTTLVFTRQFGDRTRLAKINCSAALLAGNAGASHVAATLAREAVLAARHARRYGQ